MVDIPGRRAASLAATAGTLEDLLSQGAPGAGGPTVAAVRGVLGAVRAVAQPPAREAWSREHGSDPADHLEPGRLGGAGTVDGHGKGDDPVDVDRPAGVRAVEPPAAAGVLGDGVGGVLGQLLCRF